MAGFTTSLGITQLTTGSQAGTWGDTTNNNWQFMDTAVAGVLPIPMADADYTLSTTQGSVNEARNMVLVASGANTAVRKIIAPLSTKIYVVVNNTSGGYSIDIGGATGSVVAVANGYSSLVYCDGTNFYPAGTSFNSTITASGNIIAAGALAAGTNLAVTGTSVVGGSSSVGVNLSVGGSLAVTGTTTMTGDATAPTQSTSDSSTKVATTAYVKNNLTSYAPLAGPTFSGTVSDALGPLRSVPIETKSTSYTLVAGDNGQCVSTTAGISIPASVLSAGNVVTLYNNSASSITVTQGAGLTLQFAGQSSSTTGNRTLNLYSIATVLFISPTVAVISGAGLS